MIENNYFSDNSDLTEHFEHGIDWGEIVEAYESDFRDSRIFQETGDETLAMAPGNLEEAVEFYRAVLDSLGEIVGKTVAPNAASWDREGLRLNNGEVEIPQAMIDAYRTLEDAGLHPYSFNRRFGGIGLPGSVQVLILELLARGDASLCLAFGTVNIGEVLEHFAAPEIIDEWVPRMARGEYTCCMALTEPNYGSDLTNLQLKARQDENGDWRLSGSKIFISQACGFAGVPAVILTLARSGSPGSGARGLSFFLVKGQDVEIAKIEHKLGIHCSATCEVVYNDTPALLIGEEGQGLIKGAMSMMNHARISVSAQALGIATAAYYESKKYAAERIQFGKPIGEIPAVRRMLERMERETIAMRCLLSEATRSVDLYLWRRDRLRDEGKSDKEIRKDPTVRTWEKLADFLTPLTKYYLSEVCNQLAYDAVQIHGGSGYVEEYDVARIYRDARITTIYEGTTQLQVVAAIGGASAGMVSGGFVREYLEGELKRFTPSARLREILEKYEELLAAYRAVEESELRDELALEMVEGVARLLNGLFLERGANRLEGEALIRRQKITEAYHTDSLAILAANLVRITARR